MDRTTFKRITFKFAVESRSEQSDNILLLCFYTRSLNMWSPQRELVKHAAIIASDKHPEGYNKHQLIEASREVFGGFGANHNKKVKTHEQATHYSNYLSEIDGGYPRVLSTCFAVGISGNCGVDCAQFVDGGCETPDFDLDDVLDTHGETEGLKIAECYGEFEDEINARFPLEI